MYCSFEMARVLTYQNFSTSEKRIFNFLCILYYIVLYQVLPNFQVVLCALSPYFEAMFNHDMVESRGGIVTLYDIEPEIFDCLLKFMYTGENNPMSC